MAQYNTVFHTLIKFLPRHQIDSLVLKYGQGDKRRKTSQYTQFIVICIIKILFSHYETVKHLHPFMIRILME